MVPRDLKARMVGGARSANGSVPFLSSLSLSFSCSRSLAPDDAAYSTFPDDRSMKRNTCESLLRVLTLQFRLRRCCSLKAATCLSSAA